jgi:hypothetical protein
MALFVLLITYCPMNCDIHDWRAVAETDRATCERLQPLVETERRFSRCMLAADFRAMKERTPQ